MDPQLSNALAMLRRKDADGIKHLLDEQLGIYQAKRNPNQQIPTKAPPPSNKKTVNIPPPVSKPPPVSTAPPTLSANYQLNQLKRAPPVINTSISRQESVKAPKLPKIDLTANKKNIAKIQIPKASPTVDEISKDKKAFGMFNRDNKTTSVESMDTDEDLSSSSTVNSTAVIHRQASNPKGDLSSFGQMWTTSFKKPDEKEDENGDVEIMAEGEDKLGKTKVQASFSDAFGDAVMEKSSKVKKKKKKEKNRKTSLTM